MTKKTHAREPDEILPADNPKASRARKLGIRKRRVRVDSPEALEEEREMKAADLADRVNAWSARNPDKILDPEDLPDNHFAPSKIDITLTFNFGLKPKRIAREKPELPTDSASKSSASGPRGKRKGRRSSPG